MKMKNDVVRKLIKAISLLTNAERQRLAKLLRNPHEAREIANQIEFGPVTTKPFLSLGEIEPEPINADTWGDDSLRIMLLDTDLFPKLSPMAQIVNRHFDLDLKDPRASKISRKRLADQIINRLAHLADGEKAKKVEEFFRLVAGQTSASQYFYEKVFSILTSE